MSKEKTGYYWHVHHDVLIEYSDNISERMEYIKKNKPPEEINIRLKLLKKVKGVLPKACQDAYKARWEADKAWQEADKACWEAYKACQEAYKACQEAYKAWQDEIEALHKLECPNCPWDGTTIFPTQN